MFKLISCTSTYLFSTAAISLVRTSATTTEVINHEPQRVEIVWVGGKDSLLIALLVAVRVSYVFVGAGPCARYWGGEAKESSQALHRLSSCRSSMSWEARARNARGALCCCDQVVVELCVLWYVCLRGCFAWVCMPMMLY